MVKTFLVQYTKYCSLGVILLKNSKLKKCLASCMLVTLQSSSNFALFLMTAISFSWKLHKLLSWPALLTFELDSDFFYLLSHMLTSKNLNYCVDTILPITIQNIISYLRSKWVRLGHDLTSCLTPNIKSKKECKWDLCCHCI